MKTWLLHGYESSKLWVRSILALGTNHLNFGYESSGYEMSVGTKRPVSGGRPGRKIFGFHYSNKDHELFLIIGNFLFHHRPIHENVHPCSLNECYDIFIIVFSPGGWCFKIVMLSMLGALFVSLHI